MEFSLLIPFKAGDDSRTQCLRQTVRYFREYWARTEIILVEESEAANSAIGSNLHVDRHIVVEPTFPQFCKNRCINVAFEHSIGEKVVVQDSDTFPANVLAYPSARARAGLHFNGSRQKYVTDRRVMTASIDMIIAEFPHYRYSKLTPLYYESMGPAAGSLTIPREVFEAVGGANDQWWGRFGSDNELACRLWFHCLLNDIPYGRLRGDLIHLPHDTRSWADNQNVQLDFQRVEENRKKIAEILRSMDSIEQYYRQMLPRTDRPRNPS